MPTIQITRSNEFMNRARDYQIFVDGQKVGTIANGETKEFDVALGPHSLVAKIDWCSSPELSFDDNDSKTFLVGSFKGSNWLMPLSIGVIVLHFTSMMMFDFVYFGFLLIPAFLLMVYLITLGRKNYLTLIKT